MHRKVKGGTNCCWLISGLRCKGGLACEAEAAKCRHKGSVCQRQRPPSHRLHSLPRLGDVCSQAGVGFSTECMDMEHAASHMQLCFIRQGMAAGGAAAAALTCHQQRVVQQGVGEANCRCSCIPQRAAGHGAAGRQASRQASRLTRRPTSLGRDLQPMGTAHAQTHDRRGAVSSISCGCGCGSSSSACLSDTPRLAPSSHRVLMLTSAISSPVTARQHERRWRFRQAHGKAHTLLCIACSCLHAGMLANAIMRTYAVQAAPCEGHCGSTKPRR